jgi:tocopherol cyclase
VHTSEGRQYFEGWYYRITEPSSGESWVIIVAYWENDEGEGRSFIKLIQGSTGAIYKRVFENVDISHYQKSPGEFSLHIGDLYASAEQIDGSFIDEQGAEINISLTIDACAYWGAPEDERNRWTMGWATEVIGPPLKWHVHHLKAEAHGALLISRPDAEEVRAEFSGAPIHQEKNWGRVFPKRWVWMQSNVFEGRPDVAFAAAGGPVFGFDLSPSGYMMGLRWRDQFFNWRTQDGHSFKDVEFSLDHDRGLAVWTMKAESLRYRAEITATGQISELVPIDVPAKDGLEFGAFEHLSADLQIDIYVREGLGWRLIDQVTSSHTAVEAGGELAHRILEETR